MKRGQSKEPLSTQMKRHVSRPVKTEDETGPYTGNFNTMISTGSTLLNLAISGKRVRGGGIPGGIVLEAFGPSQSGKTALLCEIAGNVQRKGGEALFEDPEARLDQEFGSMFGMKIPEENYKSPDLITSVFKDIREWEPKAQGCINGIFGDSLAALSTKMEMEDDEGDKMGMRRAKEFSEGLRKHCRIIKNKNYIFVASNQVRINSEAQNKFSPKYSVPGGLAFTFYSTVRLKFNTPEKITKEVTFNGKKIKQTIGITVEIEVIKTMDVPYRKAQVTILYGYGIDDIRDNLQFIKDHTKNNMYYVGDQKLDVSLDKSIAMVEEMKLEKKLKNEVIDLWEKISELFEPDRKQKQR